MLDRELLKQDIYEAVNGEWLKTAVIPEDRNRIGGFTDISIATEKMLIKDYNELKETDVEDKAMKEFVKFYKFTKDIDRRNKEGVNALLKKLELIENLNSLNDVVANIKELYLSGFESLYDMYVTADMMDAKNNALYLEENGIILPDKTYYEEDNAQKNDLLAKYKEVVEKVLEKFGYDEKKIQKLVSDTFEFDKLIYPYTLSSIEKADYTIFYNPRTKEQVKNYSKEVNLLEVIENVFGFVPEKIIVSNVRYLENIDKIVNEKNFPIIKSWMLVRSILSNINYLTEELRVLAGAYSRYLNGIEKEPDFERYCYEYASGVFEGVVSVYYGEKYFGEEAKKDVRKMVESMIAVYKKRLAKNKWLEKSTCENAIKKLDKFEILVGYPDTYDEYYKYMIVDTNKTFAENVMYFNRLKIKFHLDKLAKPVNRLEWHMPSSLVNAYYSPTGNLICFPAAILQAPFYSLSQSKSANYGGIGAVIGHEISHAFDNNGSKVDSDGNLVNWWTEKDYEVFNNLAKDMIAQFDGIPFGNSKVNGTLTVSENIADAGGLSCSLEALKNTEEYNLEEFFINFAKIWCTKQREELVELLLKTDVHAPARLRATIQPKNLDEFYETFDVKKGDGMYLEPEKRVKIW